MLYAWGAYSSNNSPAMSSHTDSEDPFLITQDLEIRSILRLLQRHAALVRMYVRGNADQSIITTILAFNEETGRIIVDCSQEAELNELLTKAPEVIFDTQLDHVNIHFSAQGLESTTYDGLPAISFPSPAALRRVQRREFYRVDVPLGEPASCTIPVPQADQTLRHVELALKDISSGGVALLDKDNSVPHENGRVFNNARLTLPEVGEVTVDLEVLRIHTNVLPNKKEVVELGCKFVNIPNATLNVIQSYIGRLERRLNAKRRGY